MRPWISVPVCMRSLLSLNATVAELDRLSPVDAVGRSRPTELLPDEARAAASQAFVSITEGVLPLIDDRIAALDADSAADVQDPFSWALTQLSDSLGQGIRAAEGAFADIDANDPGVFRYLMQLAMASERRPRSVCPCAALCWSHPWLALKQASAGRCTGSYFIATADHGTRRSTIMPSLSSL